MTHYLDTSVLVAALTVEKKTMAAQAWIAEQDAGSRAISDWVIAEFSSALSIKLRIGEITPDRPTESLAAFTRYAAENLVVIPIAKAHFQTAARFSDQYSLGLRASDALHLAICSDQGATLCTLDRRLGQAGAKLGLKTHLL